MYFYGVLRMISFFEFLSYCDKRFRRVLDDPADKSRESFLYRAIRVGIRKLWSHIKETYTEADGVGGFISKIFQCIFFIAFIAIVMNHLLPPYINNLMHFRMDFSQFHKIYPFLEATVNFYLLPPLIYLIIVLFFAHLIGVFLRRVHDYSGYSMQWVFDEYVKMLGKVTVIAILVAIILYASLALSTGYSSSLTLADYITWTVFVASILGSYHFFTRAFCDTRIFFIYPQMSIPFSIFCVASSLCLFDIVFSADLLDAIAKFGNSGYADAFIDRVQKIIGNRPQEEFEEAKRSLLESHLWLDKENSGTYGGILRIIKNILLMGAAILYILLYVHNRHKKKS